MRPRKRDAEESFTQFIDPIPSSGIACWEERTEVAICSLSGLLLTASLFAGIEATQACKCAAFLEMDVLAQTHRLKDSVSAFLCEHVGR